MKAIRTKYFGPGYSKGSRIIASDSDNNRVTVSYDCALSSDDNHQAAAQALLRKMGWTGSLIMGGWKRGEQFHVFQRRARRHQP